MSAEQGEKFSGEFRESDGQGGVRDGLDGEVAAAYNESGLLPKSATRVNVPSARTGKHATKFGDGTAAQERVDSSEKPNHKDQPAVPQVTRNLTRCAEDATADHISDANSKAKAYAEYAK